MPVTHKLNKAELNRVLSSPQGPVAKGLLLRGYKIQAQAKKNLGGATGSGPKRVDTGLLRSSITVQLTRGQNGALAVRVGTAVRYAYWVHEGTGLYGPRHARIYPRTARYMRWKNKATGKYVFAQSTKGMVGNPFLVKAIPAGILNKGTKAPG